MNILSTLKIKNENYHSFLKDYPYYFDFNSFTLRKTKLKKEIRSINIPIFQPYLKYKKSADTSVAMIRKQFFNEKYNMATGKFLNDIFIDINLSNFIKKIDHIIVQLEAIYVISPSYLDEEYDWRIHFKTQADLCEFLLRY